MEDTFKMVMQIQAVDFKRRNIALPEYLQKELNEMTIEQQAETEIKLVEAEYEIKK